MSEPEPTPLALYTLYLATAEKVSDRRAAANAWMLSVNSAIIGLYSYLAQAFGTVADANPFAWLLAIPAAGALVCVAWAALIDSYRKLNAAKFHVLQTIERDFPHRLFHEERLWYEAENRRSLSRIEYWVPWSFAALYATLGAFLAASAFVKPGA